MLQEANIETISITCGLQWSLAIFLVRPFVDYRVGMLTELGVLRVGASPASLPHSHLLHAFVFFHK